MAITEVGTRTIATVAAATPGSTNNQTHTTTSNTDLLLALVSMEGNEQVTLSLNEVQFNSVDLTQIHDTGATGSNGDVRIYIYGIVSPGAATATAKTSIQGNGSPLATVWLNINGVVTTSVAAATNYISEDVNTTASSTSVLTSGGSAGNGLLAYGVAQGNDMNPSSFDSGFTEVIEGVTAATTSDFAYNVASHFSGAPSGTTITWNTSDENTAVLIELVASDGGIVQQAMSHYRNHGKIF